METRRRLWQHLVFGEVREDGVGPWGALIMSFFGAVFGVWALVLAAGWRTPLLAVPPLVFAGLAVAATRKIRAAEAGAYAPSRRAAKFISWASAAEGIGIPVVALGLANTGHQSQVLPGVAAVVGLHFLPMAWGIPFRPFIGLAVCLLAAAAVGFSVHQPTGSILAGAAGALALWTASVLALERAAAAAAAARARRPGSS